MTSFTIDAERQQITRKRDPFRARATALSARVGELTQQRKAHVLAGRDREADAVTSQIQEAQGQQSAIEDAVAQLDGEMSTLDAQHAEAMAIEQRARLETEFATAREAAERDVAIMHAALKDFVFAFPALVRRARGSIANGQAAAGRLGQSFSRDLFSSAAQANVAVALEAAGHMDPRAFE